MSKHDFSIKINYAIILFIIIDGAIDIMNKEELKYLLLNFTKEVNDEKIEMILETYYSRRKNFQNYSETLKKLGRLVIEDRFPNSKEWNIIAKKEGFYSSNSIQYIEGISWKQLNEKIIKEIKSILK